MTMHKKHSFMDEVTAEWMDFEWVWQQVEPLSTFGKGYMQRLTAFTPARLAQWQIELAQTQALEELIEDQKVRAILVDSFSQLQDCRSILLLIQAGETGNETDWFKLKQFIWESKRIFEILQVCERDLNQSYSIACQLLYHLQPQQRSFALEDTAQGLTHLRLKIQSIEDQIQHVKAEQHRQLERELGIKLQGRSVLFISQKDESLIDACTAHPDLKLEQKNPFEAIFATQPTPAEQKLLQDIEHLEKAFELEVKKQLRMLAQHLHPYLEELSSWSDQLGKWDFRLAKVLWRKKLQRDGLMTCWPTYSKQLHIAECRFLPLEYPLSQEGKPYIPLNVTLSNGLSTIVGSNMSGKSIALKTIGLACAMALYGLPVPAHSCEMPLMKNVIAISGDLQDPASGLSSFSAELMRLAQAIRGDQQLLLLDELARGTNPLEGEALAEAIAQYLADKRDQFSLLVTHFSIIAAVSHAQHYRMIGLEEDGSLCHVLIKSERVEIPRYALKLAQQCGLPEAIIQAANQKIEERDTHGHAAS